MEKREFTSCITMLISVPIILLSVKPMLSMPYTYIGSEKGYKEYTFQDGEDINQYKIDYSTHTVTAYMNEDPSTGVGIKQKVTPSQILKIRDAAKAEDTGKDPIRPILEGRHYR